MNTKKSLKITKRVIRIRILKKNRENNVQKKKYKMTNRGELRLTNDCATRKHNN
jgi:hypothetical protein